jgi:hypothetical protein
LEWPVKAGELDPNVNVVADAEPAVACEREERLRQLANVFIEMFAASRRPDSTVPNEVVNQ